MNETKHGLLLDIQSNMALIECLDYRATQIKQKAKATGEDLAQYRGLFILMSTLRKQLIEMQTMMNGHERADITVINGEKQ